MNKTIVFQGSPVVKDEEEALKIIEKLNLSQKMKAIYLRILSVLFNQEQKGFVSADDLIVQLGDIARKDKRFEDSKFIISIISDMVNASIIKKGFAMTAHVKPYGANSSGKKLKNFASAEIKLLKIMEEFEPLAYENQEKGNLFNLRLMSQKLKSSGFDNITTHGVSIILESISRDMGSQKRKSITIKGGGTEKVKVVLNSPWEEIRALAFLRQNLSKTILDKIMEFIPKKFQVLCEFYLEDIHECIKKDFYYNNCDIKFKPEPDLTAVMCLNYLDRIGCVVLKSGIGIMRQAMTLRISPDCKGRQYTLGDYQPLSHYYGQKNVQVHVMEKYAKIGLDKIKNAIVFMSEYFFLPHKTFINKYFKEEKNLIETAMNSEDYRVIVESLSNNIQESIVCAKQDENILVLAGPGSGKTKTIVHRCAWLIKHECVPPNAILVLCFNHHNMMDLKKRIKKLSGVKFVSVMTYHGFAMRVCGRSLAERKTLEIEDKNFFKNILTEAVQILNGTKIIAGIEPEDSRNLFLSKYRHIFVDEYQDIDGTQYELISAITGRVEKDADEKITIMAVGDDDQNIYSFRNSNIKFIKQFEKDYDASKYFLVENYRSTYPIIETSNCLISFNKNRMKTNAPIRINQRRKKLILKEDQIDFKDKVCLVFADNYESMGNSVAEEIKRLIKEDVNLSYDDFAVISRFGISKPPLVSTRLALAAENIPFCYLLAKNCGFYISGVREFQKFFNYIDDNIEKSILPSQVKKDVLNLFDNENIWTKQLYELLDIWDEINGDIPVFIYELKKFFIEAFFEEKRDPKTGNGVFLGTVHSVKGMEFEYVFITDGGWDRPDILQSEDETRLYYVGMTRAKKGLFLYSLKDQKNLHIQKINNFPYVFQKRAKNLSIMGYKPGFRVDTIGMKDLFISYPGFFRADHPIHSNLKKLNPKDKVSLFFESNSGKIFITDEFKNKIGQLSEAGCRKWGNILKNPTKKVAARVLAIVGRTKENDDNIKLREKIKVDQWELPIIEVLHE